ncbi:MAG: thioesterase family protein [Paludibacterium sp.]|uniref:acyl-CoA thioesterase n=1 Tax=Paludibacterium sp. TaxID=1917523 RepID=UPI0025DD443A|nr:thioesterase family protein [Paludibacterium sp.]MBV8049355.1 thioesterase family protein [Paludibacterium sp.]MBV8649470.1 thioesterase family protein [Paludibacterium sp.]
MHINEILQSVQRATDSAGGFTAEVSDDWAQGRTLFGGIQAALAVQAMRCLAPDAPPLWSLHTTFVAPLPPGRIRLQTQVLRQGRAAVQMEARLMDGEQVAAVCVAVFGGLRESAVRVEPVPPAALPAREPGPALPFIPGVVPNFTQHYGYRWWEGGIPFSGAKTPGNRVLLRQRDEGALDEAQIVALADAIPPAALSMVSAPTPGSTLSWALEFVRHPAAVPSEGWWRVDVDLVAARDGYSNQDTHLFGPDGELVALARQVVAVFG